MVSKALLPAVFLVPTLIGANVCNVVDEGTTFNPDASDCDVFVLDEQFSSMVTSDVKLSLRLGSDDPIFHEGPVLFEDENALYFSTNRLDSDGAGEGKGTPVWLETAPAQLNQSIDIFKLDLNTNELNLLDTDILMANGMTKTPDGNNLLVISQGFNTTGGGIFELNRETLEVEPVVTSYYGLDLNSPNDVEVTNDEIMFFDDPVYAFEQGFRPVKNPALGSNMYRFDIPTKSQTLLTTALQRPNGVALFDDRENGNGCRLFISDSGYETADIGKSVQTPRGFFGGDGALYTMKDDGDECFAPTDGPWVLQPLVPSTKGIIDGMEVHRAAELLLYCDGTGLWIWSLSQNKNIGLVRQPCVQLIFSQELGLKTVFILNDNNLYEIELNFEASEENPSEVPEESPSEESSGRSGKSGKKSKSFKSTTTDQSNDSPGNLRSTTRVT